MLVQPWLGLGRVQRVAVRRHSRRFSMGQAELVWFLGEVGGAVVEGAADGG